MKYIGLSLGGCLLSLMNGEVSEDDVMFIVTRTMCPNYERYVGVVKAYHAQGNPFARNFERYELGDHDEEKVLELATRLYYGGKIHQPRVFVDESGLGHGTYRHPAGYGNGLWMQVVPENDNTNPAVVEAYEKYKMLDTLTK